MFKHGNLTGAGFRHRLVAVQGGEQTVAVPGLHKFGNLAVEPAANINLIQHQPVLGTRRHAGRIKTVLQTRQQGHRSGIRQQQGQPQVGQRRHRVQRRRRPRRQIHHQHGVRLLRQAAQARAQKPRRLQRLVQLAALGAVGGAVGQHPDAASAVEHPRHPVARRRAAPRQPAGFAQGNAEMQAQTVLRIQIQSEGAVARGGNTVGEMRRARGLTHAPFWGCDRDQHRVGHLSLFSPGPTAMRRNNCLSGCSSPASGWSCSTSRR